jgi:S-adenosyl-L-methionine hydrolase (adenosine-forming)
MGSVITLTTDFGAHDGYVAAMKGVILGIAPGVSLVDISHEVAPQDVAGAAYLLAGVYRFFPPATVHLIVVDPAVGTARRALAARAGEHLFVAPDNGVLTPVFDATLEVEVVSLSNAGYWRREVSHTFHGRDIFAPVAAHLASGVPLEALGTPVRDPVRLDLPAPRSFGGTVEGTVVWVDHFGNLVSNIPADVLVPGETYRVTVGRLMVTGLFTTYAQVRAGQPLALVGSHGFIEVAVREGSAAEMAGAARGAMVRLEPAS